ncbi:hypothetical protein GGQ97_000791 [Sphingomonas kaistensis]|uniref:Uncharacterized protein n=1 Tax=Sphingomonas kaistensis TaxID=298708 RepID=A0A7X5Y5A3_9SPHN|nr:hypothetical protein [Sphingomonas kaistensis]NJC04998.1 hypothetical protein [Sphingomonas kaistensis]
MRAVILVLMLLIVGAIALVATGFVNINQTQPAQAPGVAVGSDGVVVKGGQKPEFEVQTGRIEVGSGKATIPVPEIRVAPGGNGNASAQPQPAPAQPAGQQPATTDSTQ